MNSNARIRPNTDKLSYIFFRSKFFSFPLNFNISFVWKNLFIRESFSYNFISKRFSCLLLLKIDDLKLWNHLWNLSSVFITAEQVANITYWNTDNIKSLNWIFFLTLDVFFRVQKLIITRLSFSILKELRNCVSSIAYYYIWKFSSRFFSKRVLEKYGTLWSVSSFLYF